MSLSQALNQFAQNLGRYPANTDQRESGRPVHPLYSFLKLFASFI